MVLQLYYSFSIFASSWLLLLFSDNPSVSNSGKFTFSYWGIIGASLWVPASVFSIYAIRFLGLSIAQGLWSGLTILVSFLWGAVVFLDPIKNIWFTLLGLLLLFVGIFGVALCKSSPEKDNESTDVQKYYSQEHGRLILEKGEKSSLASTKYIYSTNPHNEMAVSEPIFETNMTAYQKFKYLLLKSKNLLLGIICCCCLGLFNGSMMVPTRYNPDKSIMYCLSFGIGVMIVTPILFVIYFLCKRQIPALYIKQALYPGLLTGFIWNLGNIGSTIAALSPLGLTVGFPLTQCALVVGGISGIIIFRELRGWRPILQFTVFTLFFLLPGCMLLAIFGKK
jgi:glucose uptake protein GlcU